MFPDRARSSIQGESTHLYVCEQPRFEHMYVQPQSEHLCVLPEYGVCGMALRCCVCVQYGCVHVCVQPTSKHSLVLGKILSAIHRAGAASITR